MMNSQSVRDAALEYAARGWAVFPVKAGTKQPRTAHGFKDATRDPAKIKEWYSRYPDDGVAIATGPRSGLLVIDIDEDEEKGKHGRQTLEDWELLHESLPATLTARTGRGGQHLYFSYDGEIGNRTGLREGIDIRARGGYVVAPPTIHPNGTPYEWESGTDQEPAEINDVVLAFLRITASEAFKDDDLEGPERFEMPETIPEGQRTSFLVRLLGSLQGKGLSDTAIRSAIRAENEEKCVPPLTDRELDREVFPALTRFPKEPMQFTAGDAVDAELVAQLHRMKAATNYKHNDSGSSALFSDIFENRHRYCPEWRDWAYFDGRCWVKDKEAMQARQSAKALAAALMVYAPAAGLDEEKDKQYRKYVAGLGSLRARKAMIEDSKDNKCFRVTELDRAPFLFNCENGVLDLRHGFKFIPHAPGLLLSKIAPVEYDPAAEAPIWRKFLDDVMEGEATKIRYLQKFAGISLTGDTREETMVILYGATTRNGKSTFVETLGHLLGDYAITIRPETLAFKKDRDSRRASGDLARLAGARFVSASEPPKGMLFDAAQIKSMIGRDTITARNLFESEFSFVPIFKIVMNTNYLPQIGDDTIFTSGRVNVVTFDRHFSGAEQDRTLKDRLREPKELSGILNWCLDGLRLYRKEGLRPPAAVVKATKLYREQSDKIGQFLEECLEESPKTGVKAGDVYIAYQGWCRESGYGAEGKRNFFSDLQRRGLFADRGTIGGKTVRNIIPGYELVEKYRFDDM